MCQWIVPLITVVLTLNSADTREISSLDGATLDNHVSSGNRSQRFLFDAIFGLEVPILEEQSIEDDDDDPQVQKCSCECGRANLLPRKLECGGSNQENRIVGGMPAGANRYPWMARIVYDGQFHCGASLLTKEYVLTAAHCVRKLKRSKIRVILGDHDQTITTESAAIMRAVTAIVRHRSFDADSYNNDIALLKLRKPVNFSKIIKPVCLPPANVDPSGKEGVVVGWGRTSEGGQLPAIVQEVRVPILSLSQCRAMKYRASRITNNMLCAGRASTDSCQGDSGGPLLIQTGDKFQIVGIVSWGVGCGRPGYPGVYTRITRYLPWLRANLHKMWKCIVLVLAVTTFTCTEGDVVRDTRGVFTKNFFGGVWGNRPPLMEVNQAKATCTCKCGERNEGPRIVGGEEAGINEFPWMARLTYFKRFYCGGMLINDRYVLTAAHCVKGFMWFMIKVTFGEHNRCNSTVRPETRFVLRAIANKFSLSNFDNDIALLRLNERVPLSDAIKPICLPSNDDNLYVGVKAVASGWGTLTEEGKVSCTLQEVEVPVISNQECRSTKYTASMITDHMLCAGYPGTGQKDSCQGDSGGPLITERKSDKRYELIGVVSWGNGCARAGYPGVYTRVTHYLDWIRENTKDACYCTE
ncbi:hypothetical protein ABMA27_001420 [Loxostege sticticalis]|uniref:Peptidase S1 domain-containing protein n=2 Tax=Loxostege sticticalis TaxID=481309 RepID=A0ABR3HYF5_LOXSC